MPPAHKTLLQACYVVLALSWLAVLFQISRLIGYVIGRTWGGP